jgi:threonine/homoserine/homoserine lactone efflux protein
MAYMLAILLQVAGEFTPEQYHHNFQFLFYGLLTAWLVLLAFVAMLAARERKLRRELERLRVMIEDREKERG